MIDKKEPECNCGSVPFPFKLRAKEGGFERIASFRPGFICPVKGAHSHGQHGMDLCFGLRRNRHGLLFTIFTNWGVDWESPHVGDEKLEPLFCLPQPAQMTFHSSKPMYEGQELSGGNCIITGGDCYADSGYLIGEPTFKVFVREGEDAMFKRMEEIFESNFPGV